MSQREEFIEKLKTNDNSNDFIPLNKTFSYGRTKNTLHVHLIPKDLHSLKDKLGEDNFCVYITQELEDFLSRLQKIVESDPSIENVFAVSPIFYHDTWKFAFEDEGFDIVKEILLDENDGMSIEQKKFFLDMFKGRRVFYTNISREELLSRGYTKFEDVNKQYEEIIDE